MEKLEIEFRYMDARVDFTDDICESRTAFVKLYDNIEDAIKDGNKLLSILSDKGFEIRDYDKFKLHGLLGGPERLVSNCCYDTKIVYFAQITNIGNNNVEEAIDNALEGLERHKQYKKIKSHK